MQHLGCAVYGCPGCCSAAWWHHFAPVGAEGSRELMTTRGAQRNLFRWGMQGRKREVIEGRVGGRRESVARLGSLAHTLQYRSMCRGVSVCCICSPMHDNPSRAVKT
jgi:hypothetical protein